MKTLYGVGTDWPISYEDLSPYYDRAGAIMNPFILERSGIRHPKLGKFLYKQPYTSVSIDLTKLDSFQASSSI